MNLIIIFYYCFKDKNIVQLIFFTFRGPLNTYENIKNRNIPIKKVKENQEQFKSNLNKIARGNPKAKLKCQLDTIKNIRNIYEWREKVLKL